MTNQDINLELITIKEALFSLKEISKNSDLSAIDLKSFIDMISDRYIKLETELEVILDRNEVLQGYYDNGLDGMGEALKRSN